MSFQPKCGPPNLDFYKSWALFWSLSGSWGSLRDSFWALLEFRRLPCDLRGASSGHIERLCCAVRSSIKVIPPPHLAPEQTLLHFLLFFGVAPQPPVLHRPPVAQFLGPSGRGWGGSLRSHTPSDPKCVGGFCSADCAELLFIK
jgi:hypothetical protein